LTLDTTLLQTFLEVARLRHFGKAAEQLFVTQSAVSARVKLLEESLGVALFTRKRNDIQLTPAGNRLLKHAETIVTSWERARQDVGLEPEFAEILALGGVFDLWAVLLRDWVGRLRARYRHIALTVEAQGQEALIRRLADGVLDLVFLFEPPQLPDLTLRQVARVPLVLVSSRPGLDAQEALSHDHVMVDWGISFPATYSLHPPDAPAPSLRLGQATFALDMLLTRGGSAYLPEQMVADPLASGVLHRVAGALCIERHVYAVTRQDCDRAGLIEEMLESIG
jgi:DNA-binding transcriptional LysR family regulator